MKTKPNYRVTQDSFHISTPHIELKASCPDGIDIELVKQLIGTCAELEFTVRKNVSGGTMFASSSRFPGLRIDSGLPADVIEFRDENGVVLHRVEGLGKVKRNPLDDDEED